MPTLFHITPASSSVALDSSRRGKATFTVTNASGLQMSARASAAAIDANTRGWFRLAEDPEHNFGDGDTTQYTVQINVPADAPAGPVSFRLDVVGIENPDEDYTEGPPVQVLVPEKEPEPKPFPWWILAVVGGVLLVGIILALVLWPRDVRVPYVRGLPEAAAWATIQAAKLEPVVEERADQAPAGQAIGTTPEAETEVERGSEVNLIISAGQTATPVPTATPEPTPTEEPTPTRESTPTPKPVIGFDFVARAQEAEWIVGGPSTGAGTRIEFGGPRDDPRGFALWPDWDFAMEDGTQPAPKTTLYTHPKWEDNGVISGQFPAYTVQRGDHFRAEFGYIWQRADAESDHKVRVQVNYKLDGRLASLYNETKSYSTKLSDLDLDLSSLVGQRVDFVLAVTAEGSSGRDWAVWVNPRIERP